MSQTNPEAISHRIAFTKTNEHKKRERERDLLSCVQSENGHGVSERKEKVEEQRQGRRHTRQ